MAMDATKLSDISTSVSGSPRTLSKRPITTIFKEVLLIMIMICIINTDYMSTSIGNLFPLCGETGKNNKLAIYGVGAISTSIILLLSGDGLL